MQIRRLLLALVMFIPLSTCATQSDIQSAPLQEENRQKAHLNQEQIANALFMYAEADFAPLEVHVIDVGQADAILIICLDGVAWQIHRSLIINLLKTSIRDRSIEDRPRGIALKNEEY